MESITYRKRLDRTEVGNSFLALMSLILAMQLFDLPPLSSAGRLAVAVVLGFVILALLFTFLIEQFAPALAFWSPATMPADNFLRLSDDGLTYVHRGRARNWRWSELSEITRRWRCIVVALPDDDRIGLFARWRGRLAGSGPRLTIMDDYVLPIDQLAAKLREHRPATPEARQPARAGNAKERADGPAALPVLKFHQRRRVEAAGVWAVMAVLSLPAVVAMLILFWRNDIAGLAVLGGLTLLVCLLIGAVAVAAEAKRVNCLSLDPKGLRYTRHGLSLAWPWHELSTFELRQIPPQPWYSKFWGGQTIVFTARGDEGVASNGREAWFRVAGSEAYAIQDSYDTRLAEILAKLNEYRERALSGGPARSRP